MNRRYRLFVLDNISAPNFLLTPLELCDYIPFKVKRIYFISHPQGSKKTGNHCHLALESEIFIQVQGKCTIVVDDGHGLEEIELSGLKNAIYLPTKVWHHFKNMSDDCLILALTSTKYDPSRSDYCDNYEEFKNLLDQNKVSSAK